MKEMRFLRLDIINTNAEPSVSEDGYILHPGNYIKTENRSAANTKQMENVPVKTT